MKNRNLFTRLFLSLVALSVFSSCAAKPGAVINRMPEECTEVITAAERYWQIFKEVQENPNKGLEFSEELSKIPIPSQMETVRHTLTYLVEDEHDCWMVPSSYYYCHPIDKERREFIQAMEYLWQIYLPNDLSACAPLLESMYNQNQP